MKSIVSKLFMIIAVVSLLSACGGSKTPGETVKGLLEAMADGDYDKVIDGYSTGGEEISQEDRDKLKGFMSAAGEQLTEMEGIKSIEILNEEIDESGEKATVEYKMVFGNDKEETETVNMVMEDGHWKMVMEM